MSRRATSTLLLAALAALAASAVLAAGASAAPAWKFGGKSLEGNETVVAGPTTLSMAFAGLTTECETTFFMTIFNSSGTAKGNVTGVNFANCTTGTVCLVESAEAEQLPWPLRGVTILAKNYVVIEAIRVGVLYEGEECVIGGLLVKTTGTAGGLFDNTTSSATFDPSTFKATGTALKALGTPVEWNGLFPFKATGFYSGQPLTLS